jgi:hypothetical protein
MPDAREIPTDNRYRLSIPDSSLDPNLASIQAWADRIPGVGPWQLIRNVAGYNSTWADFGTTDRPVRIRREFHDIVRIEGVFKSTANIIISTPVFKLPPQFRPVRGAQLAAAGANINATTTFAAFEINAAGEFYVTECYPYPGAAVPVGYIRVGATYTISPDR